MPAAVSLNGTLLAPDALPTVSALDAGLLHGVGLFETLLGGVDASGEPHFAHLAEHLERLETSALALNLARELNREALRADLVNTLRASGLRRARVRLTLTPGDTNLLQQARAEAEGQNVPPPSGPTVLVVATPAVEYPEELFERGGSITIADLRVNPLNAFESHKTLNYWPRLHALAQAARRRAVEALVFNVTNHVAGACVGNVLLVKDDTIITPIARGEEQLVAGHGTPLPSLALPSPVLPGTVRAWALEWATARGMVVERRMLSIDDVLAADEVLITNSGWGVLPVVKVEKEAIADGIPGPTARDLRQAFLALLPA
jgi:branched-chain amino acid aminotransferase